MTNINLSEKEQPKGQSKQSSFHQNSDFLKNQIVTQSYSEDKIYYASRYFSNGDNIWSHKPTNIPPQPVKIVNLDNNQVSNCTVQLLTKAGRAKKGSANNLSIFGTDIFETLSEAEINYGNQLFEYQNKLIEDMESLKREYAKVETVKNTMLGFEE